MENALSIWIDDSCQKRIPLDGNIIKQKALQIYKHLKEHGESSVNPDFVAKVGLSLAKNLESFFLNTDSSAERSQKFKKELQNCLAPYREIYNNLVRTIKQSKITDFLKREEDARTLNKEKSSESEGDIIPPKKHSWLIIHTEQ
ncbi:hypothetical protein J437_LFUL010989 [Ladona fulva]|uniref:HTH CENPB-type domain-containing protein n=1 Tax=Ladona fulva TaxID=123851 RepID=A0A8K0KJ61_LADFU|nr:hypothetical protein J437_LFUL010989 [Ladona fulva]